MGIALLIYFIPKRPLLPFLVSASTCIGSYALNLSYLDYQGEWYRQISLLQHILNESSEMLEGGNYVIDLKPSSRIGDTRFYTLTGLVVANSESRDLMLLNGNADIRIINDSKIIDSIVKHYPMFKQYNHRHVSVDGYVQFSLKLGYRDITKLKLLEFRNDGSLEEELASMGDYSYSFDRA